MKITVVHGFFLPIPPLAGGAMEKMWWRLAREFAGRGHEVVSISRRWPGLPDEEIREGVRCLRLPGFDHTRRLSLNLLLDALWGLRVLRRLPRADILVTNTVLLPCLAAALRPRAGRVVVNLNRMPKGQLRAYGRIARLQVPSSAVADAARRQAPGLGDRLRIFPNIIDSAPLRAARDPRAPDGPVRLGYIGRIHPEKGLRVLVEAALLLSDRPRLPAWTLTLRGPDDVSRGGGGESFVAELRARAAPLLADGRLVFAPAEFDPAALARAYRELDVFVYPSFAINGETFGVGIAEAMAAGAVPVVSDLPCFGDLVRHDHNGLIFSRAAPSPALALADAMESLLVSPDRRLAWAKTAQTDSTLCDAGPVADAMLADFASLLSRS